MRPSMKRFAFSAFVILFSIFAKAQDRAENNVLFENQNVRITYTIESCNVANSDLVFEYYLIDIVNKTDRKLNLQYWSRPKTEDTSVEHFHSLILEPNQELRPKCQENNPGIRIYRSRLVDGKYIDVMELQLNSFEVFTL